jgi:hypothetical protein
LTSPKDWPSSCWPTTYWLTIEMVSPITSMTGLSSSS